MSSYYKESTRSGDLGDAMNAMESHHICRGNSCVAIEVASVPFVIICVSLVALSIIIIKKFKKQNKNLKNVKKENKNLYVEVRPPESLRAWNDYWSSSSSEEDIITPEAHEALNMKDKKSRNKFLNKMKNNYKKLLFYENQQWHINFRYVQHRMFYTNMEQEALLWLILRSEEFCMVYLERFDRDLLNECIERRDTARALLCRLRISDQIQPELFVEQAETARYYPFENYKAASLDVLYSFVKKHVAATGEPPMIKPDFNDLTQELKFMRKMSRKFPRLFSHRYHENTGVEAYHFDSTQLGSRSLYRTDETEFILHYTRKYVSFEERGYGVYFRFDHGIFRKWQWAKRTLMSTEEYLENGIYNFDKLVSLQFYEELSDEYNYHLYSPADHLETRFKIVQELLVFRNLEIQPESGNPKDFSKSKNKKREENSIRDVRRQREKLRKEKNKLLMRIRNLKNEQKPIEPEGQCMRDEFWEMPLSRFVEYSESDIPECVSAFSLTDTIKNVTKNEYFDIFLKTLSATIAVAQQETYEKMATVLLAVVSQHVSFTDTIYYLEGIFEEEDVTPESSAIEFCREGLQALQELPTFIHGTPLAGAFLNLFSLACYCNLVPDDHPRDFVRNMIVNTKRLCMHQGSDFYTNILNVLSYVLEMCELRGQGVPMLQLFHPRSLYTEVSFLKTRKISYLDGSLEKAYGMTKLEYRDRLEICQSRLRIEVMKKPSLPPPLLNRYVAYSSELDEIRASVKIDQESFKLRKAPFTFTLYGKSGQGKSTVLQEIYADAGHRFNFPSGAQHQYILDEMDKYHSGIKTETTIITGDDVGNAKNSSSNMAETIQAQIILLQNNQPFLARQAEAEKKGTIQLTPRMFGMTTNVSDLNAAEVSKCPISILRRSYFCELRAKKEFLNSAGVVDPGLVTTEQMRKGIQEFRFYEHRSNHEQGKTFHEVQMEPDFTHPTRAFKECRTEKWVSYMEGKRAILRAMELHEEQQNRVLDMAHNIHKVERCPVCKFNVHQCLCSHTPEGIFLDLLDDEKCHSMFREMSSLMPNSNWRQLVMMRVATFCLQRWLEIPEDARPFALIKYFSVFMFSQVILILVVAVIGGPVLLLAYFSCLGYLIYDFASSLGVLSRKTLEIYWRRSGKQMIGKIYKPVLVGVTASAIFYAAYQGYKMINQWKKLLPESVLQPTSREEVVENMAKVDIFYEPPKEELFAPHEIRTMTREQVISRVEKNLILIEFYGIGAYESQALLISSGKILIPQHYHRNMKSKGLDTSIVRLIRGPLTEAQNLRSHVTWERIGKTDFMIGSLASHVPCRSLLEMFPDSFVNTTGTMTSRTGSSREFVKRSVMYIAHDNITNNAYDDEGRIFGKGSSHKVYPPTEKGDCLSPIISNNKPHMIIGFHAGGNGHGNAVCFSLTRKELEPRIGKIYYNGIKDYSFVKDKICAPEDLHDRSVCNYMLLSPDLKPPSLDVYGHDKSFRITPRTGMRHSPISRSLGNHGLDTKFRLPRFRSDRNHARIFQKACRGMDSIDMELVSRSSDDYLSELIAEMKDKVPLRGPLTVEEALNGVKDNRFIKRLDIDKASGPGYGGKKKKYVVVEHTEEGRYVTLMPGFEDFIEQELERYKKGVAKPFICKTALKDEAITEEKLTKHAIRVFAVSDMDVLIIGKMLVAPVLAALYSFPLMSELLQGVNFQGPAWKEVYEHVLLPSPDMILEGDFSGYDYHLSGQLIREVGKIIAHVAREILLYTNEELLAIETYFYEISLNLWIFNGDLFIKDGYNPSGNYCTIAINGIANSLIHRCVFFKIYPEELSFRSKVKLVTVGDDSLGSSLLPDFNMRTISEVLAEWNMTYTDGHKLPHFPPFYTLRDPIAFCKRGFRMTEDGICEAPLSVESILRSLHFQHESEATPESVLHQVLIAAFLELSRHPKIVYEDITSKIREALRDENLLYLESRSDWTYEHWVRFRMRRQFDLVDQEENLDESMFMSDDIEPEDHLDRGCLIPSASIVSDTLVTDFSTGNRKGTLVLQLIPISLSEPPDPRVLVVNYRWISSKIFEERSSRASENDKHETVGFEGDVDIWKSGMENQMEASMLTGNTSETNDGFFLRPVRIASFQWPISVDVNVRINPWKLFLENPVVNNRLAHFKNFRGCLNVRFQLNGNKFYYGRLLCSYLPLPVYDERTLMRPGNRGDLVQATQRPHVTLNPTTSQGGELCCPFIWPKNFVNIIDHEWDQLGVIDVVTFNPLENSQGIGDPLTISVYAWCENIELATPTSRLSSVIQPQAKDEYGVISAPAHSVANWTGKFSKMPIIGKYARATEIIGTAVGDTAQLFGFSTPREVDKPAQECQSTHEYAVTTKRDKSMSLAVDPKKEVTIDPRVVGASIGDEMALVPLAMKESYLTTFDWSISDGVDFHLFGIDVTPMQQRVEGGQLFQTPSAWVATPFSYWTGSMQFRFQVVCNSFHRGRLRFVWDPEFYLGNAYNTNYQQIIDIDEASDFKMTIGWGQDVNYLETWNSLEPSYSVIERQFKNPYANGVLNVYVVNELVTSNDDASSIQINVYANACDDFEVAVPKADWMDSLVPAATTPPRDIVLKVINPMAVFFGDVVPGISNRVVNSPQYTNQVGVSQGTFPPLIENGGTSSGFMTVVGDGNTPSTVSFNFIQTTNGGPTNITVTLNGISDSVILPQNIGEDASVSITSVWPSGVNLLQWFMDVDGISRPLLNTVTVPLYAEMTPVIVDLDQLVGTIFTTPSGGEYPLNISGGNSLSMPLPDKAEGTPANFVTTASDFGVRGADYIATDLISNTNGIIMNDAQNDTSIVFDPDSSGNTWPVREVVYLQDIVPESGIRPESLDGEDQVEQANAPEEVVQQFYMAPSVIPGTTTIFFGEQIQSWRSILKRSSTIFTLKGGNSAFIGVRFGDRPFIPTVNAPGINIVENQHLYWWVSPAYVASRGSVRWKILDARTINTPGRDNIYVVNRVPSTSNQAVVFLSNNDKKISYNGGGAGNLLLTGGAEVEIPWYNNFRFTPSRSVQQHDPDRFVKGQGFVYTTSYGGGTVASSFCVGEDFMLAHFLCTPVFDLLN